MTRELMTRSNLQEMMGKVDRIQEDLHLLVNMNQASQPVKPLLELIQWRRSRWNNLLSSQAKSLMAFSVYVFLFTFKSAVC